MNLSILTFQMVYCVFTRKLNVFDIGRLCEKNGIHIIDPIDFELKLYGLKKFQQMASQHNIHVNTYVASMPLLKGSKDDLAKKISGAISVAHELGAKRLMVTPDLAKNMNPDEKRQRYIDSFRFLQEKVSSKNLIFLFEDTEQIGCGLSTGVECEAVVRAVPGLHLTFDTGNMIPNGDDPIAFYQRLKPYIKHVHLKEVKYTNKKLSMPTVDGRRLTGDIWGEGIVPIAQIIDMLENDGYSGDFVIEYSLPSGKKDFAANDAQLKRYLDFLKTRKAALI